LHVYNRLVLISLSTRASIIFIIDNLSPFGDSQDEEFEEQFGVYSLTQSLCQLYLVSA